LGTSRSALEQSDLAEASGISIATVRKIEQGATGTRPHTEARIIAAFERAGLQLIPEGPDGGAGVRLKERAMDEQMREYLDLKNKLKGWFVYNLGRKDDEDLDDMIVELASEYDLGEPDRASYNETLTRWGLTTATLPPSLVADLKKVGDMGNEISLQQGEQSLKALKEAEEEDLEAED